MESNELETAKDFLSSMDELVVLDLLEIDIETLLGRFEDHIVEHYEKIRQAINNG